MPGVGLVLEEEPGLEASRLEERQQRAQVGLHAAHHGPVPRDEEDAPPWPHGAPVGFDTDRRAKSAFHRGRT